MPRLVLISDTHTFHDKLKLPKGDILIHAGDFTLNGSSKEVELFGEWLLYQDFKHKIVIAGNHDLLCQRKPEAARLLLFDNYANIHYLQDSSVIIEGIRFYGSPWQPWFMDWAFNLPRGKALKEKWDLIPNDTRVLITHGPPYRLLDRVCGDHVGCEELLKAVERVQPQIHVFGHIHVGRGYWKYHGTEFFNVTVVNEEYRVVYEPMVIDL